MRTKCICGTATCRPVAGRSRKGPKFSGPWWVPVIVERKARIEAIAERAGVAVSTVYSIFGSKRGILRAIREAWHAQSGQREIYQAALEQIDPRRRMQLAAHATRRQWETSAAMIAIYTQAAAVDQEAAAELEQALRGRRVFLDRFIEAITPALRPELSPERGAAIFWTLTLPYLYQELVEQAGWSPDDYETWLSALLIQQLLAS